MDGANVFGTVLLFIFIFRLVMSFIIASRAKRKGLSGVGYFFLSIFVSVIIAWIVLASSKPTGPGPGSVINLRLGNSMVLKNNVYTADAQQYGDWMIQPHKGSDWAVVTTKRAFQFLLDRLGEDGQTDLRNRLIEARQGKTLEG